MNLREKVVEQYANLLPIETKKQLIGEETKSVASLLSLYERWLHLLEIPEEAYDAYVDCANKALFWSSPFFCYTPRDVEDFFLALPSFSSHRQFSRTGYFLSAVLNHLSSKDIHGPYTFDMRLFENIFGSDVEKWADGAPFGGICSMLNGADVRLRGERLISVCDNMEAGRVIIAGNVEDVGRHMKGGIVCVTGRAAKVGEFLEGGTIICLGDANGVGQKMKAGTIVVTGNVARIEARPYTVPEYLGGGMSGGTIRVKGACFDQLACDEMTGGVVHFDDGYAGIANTIKGGEVYHRGVRVWPR